MFLIVIRIIISSMRRFEANYTEDRKVASRYYKAHTILNIIIIVSLTPPPHKYPTPTRQYSWHLNLFITKNTLRNQPTGEVEVTHLI